MQTPKQANTNAQGAKADNRSTHQTEQRVATPSKKEPSKEQLAFQTEVTKENVQRYIEHNHKITMAHLFNIEFKKKAKYHAIVNNTMYAFSRYYFNSRTGIFQTRVRQKHSSYMRTIPDERYTSFQQLHSLDELVKDIQRYRGIRKQKERDQFLIDQEKMEALAKRKEQEKEIER